MLTAVLVPVYTKRGSEQLADATYRALSTSVCYLKRHYNHRVDASANQSNDRGNLPSRCAGIGWMLSPFSRHVSLYKLAHQ